MVQLYGARGFWNEPNEEELSPASQRRIIRRQTVSRKDSHGTRNNTSSCIQGFTGGWKCALDAGVVHHNHSHTTALGFSPSFAAFERAGYLPVDVQLHIKDYLTMMEKMSTPQPQETYNKRIRKTFNTKFR